jgi:2',3'-cyclic-nucleotide 2'-phosphodiesterase (5'-nucleotidase family)
LSANALGPDGRLLGDAPYALLEKDGIKIGIIGLLTETAPTLFTPIGNEGLTFLKPADLLRELIPELRPQVDVLILLSHIGHENELKLADEFPALDVIIGGHSHTLVEHPIRVGNTLVAQANHYGTHLGIIKLKLEGTPLSITETFGDLIAADELPEGKPEVKNLVSLYESKVEALVDVTLTQVDYDYSADALQPLLENILATAAGTDLGYYNRTGIRDQLARGDVTARMVWNIEPFGNTLVKMTLSGADLLILLSQEPSLHHAASDIDPERQYSLATNSFIASHASLTFGEDITTLDTGLMIRDILIEHLRDQGLPPPRR